MERERGNDFSQKGGERAREREREVFDRIVGEEKEKEERGEEAEEEFGERDEDRG